ncbi:MAG: hypothetical protein LLF76_08785 [Planctomycetaceae bacterium]|nr:hypothetical protein [Planctomycetaceae bacterium]
MNSFRPWKMFVVIAALLLCVWIAVPYAAQRPVRSDNNSYDVIVGPQKSDMQRMIEAYERLSEQYLVVVQDNLALMANQDKLILEKLSNLEKQVDLLSQKLDAMQSGASARSAAAEQQKTADVQ